MPVISRSLLLLAATGVLSIHSYAATIIGSTADNEVTSTGVGSVGSALMTAISSYNYAFGSVERTKSPILVFQLPSLGAGVTFSSATLSFNLTAKSGSGVNLNLLGINSTNASSFVGSGLFNAGATTLQSSIATPSTAAGTVTSQNLSTWLNNRYGAGANAGQYVFLRLDTSTSMSSLFDASYTIASADSGIAPYLTYTTTAVPEPGIYGLIGAGALGAAALIRRRRKSA